MFNGPPDQPPQNHEQKEQLKREMLHAFHTQKESALANTQKIRITNEQFNRIVVNEFLQVFFAVFGVALSILMNEQGMLAVE